MDSWWNNNSKNKLLSKIEPVSDERARKIQEDLIEEKEEMKHHVRMLEYDYIEKPLNADDMELVSNVKQIEEDDQNGDEDSNYQKDYENGGDDLVDPQAELKSECQTSHCSELMDELIECNKRVNGKRQTLETCEQELYDMIHCVDHCVSKTLFSRLK
ncbi:cytochrome b-c1 complex subunit 6, mitochondrial-like [Nilaparvata lugens]|uniref:cytochrome b-c1 complex subunit 6, mitochondrial-like n=1 Tax=Nilaparvata lugens TaxID=108931 RepID=UPI00193D51CD|nr:cytochrome b-c1 complex subunit 6, mitochondrial-like [Nilaparvata lugens]